MAGKDEKKPLLDESALNSKYGDKAADTEISKTQRKELVKGVARGDEASERLDKAYSMAQNTANAGDEILNKLHDQREKILSARCSAEAMEGDMDTSERKMSRMACEKCIQRWILWVIAFMFIGGLLFFLYWKLEIEPEKSRNCRRDQQGKCIEGEGEYDGSSRRSRAGSGQESRLGRYYYEDAYAKGYENAAAAGGGRGDGAGVGGGRVGRRSGGEGGHRRMLSDTTRAGAGVGAGVGEALVAAEDLDARTFLRYKARATMFW